MKQIKAEDQKIKPEQGTKKQQKRPPKKITETYLHNAGLFYLQRFAASSGQFRTVMRRKILKSCRHHKDQDREECEDLLEKLILKFIDCGLLDDDAYTKAVITSLRRRGLSKQVILYRLKAKGIEQDRALEQLSRHDEQNDVDERQAEKTAALVFAKKKKLGPYKISEKMTEEKALSSLARAGFSYDTARFVFDKNIDEAEDYLRRC